MGTVKVEWDSGGHRLVLGMLDYDRRRRWSQATLGVLGEKAKMVRFSSKGDDNNVAGNGDGKFCAKSMVISKYHSIVAEVNSPFR